MRSLLPSLSLIGAVFLVCGLERSQAQTFGVQLYTSGQGSSNSLPLGAGDVAGVVPQDNYNILNLANPSVTVSNLTTASGGASSVNFTLGNNGDIYITGTGVATPNDKLLSSQGGDFNGNSSTLSFSNLAAGAYDLYVYTVTNSDGDTASLSLNTGTASGPTNYFFTEQNGVNFNGTFNRSTATSQSVIAGPSNYVEFASVSPTAGTLKVTLNAITPDNADGIGLNAVELVELPEPSTYALLLVGVGGLFFLARRRLGRA